jgi:plastocyanin
MKQWFVLLLLAVMVVLVCGCTDTSAPEATVPEALTTAATPAVTAALATETPASAPTKISVSDNTINIRNNLYSQANLTVKAGSTVRWVNGDDHPHNIQFTDLRTKKTTKLQLLGPSQSASQRFDRAGTFEYHCLIYPETNGYITVVE